MPELGWTSLMAAWLPSKPECTVVQRMQGLKQGERQAKVPSEVARFERLAQATDQDIDPLRYIRCMASHRPKSSLLSVYSCSSHDLKRDSLALCGIR
jgi:hypothetical protein